MKVWKSMADDEVIIDEFDDDESVKVDRHYASGRQYICLSKAKAQELLQKLPGIIDAPPGTGAPIV